MACRICATRGQGRIVTDAFASATSKGTAHDEEGGPGEGGVFASAPRAGAAKLRHYRGRWTARSDRNTLASMSDDGKDDSDPLDFSF